MKSFSLDETLIDEYLSQTDPKKKTKSESNALFQVIHCLERGAEAVVGVGRGGRGGVEDVLEDVDERRAGRRGGAGRAAGRRRSRRRRRQAQKIGALVAASIKIQSISRVDWRTVEIEGTIGAKKMESEVIFNTAGLRK